MYDLFYILEVRPQWYNLIVKDTHYCIACGGDLEKIRRTIYNYVRKYKVEDRVYRVISGLEDGGKVPTATFNRRHLHYIHGDHLVFNDLVRGVVSEALKDNRQDTPYHHAKKKVRTIVPHTVVVASPLTPQNEVKVVKKIVPRKIKGLLYSGLTTQ